MKVEHLHRQFQSEVITAARAFFLWKAIRSYASEDPEIFKVVNDHALSWNIITHSLQTTFLIVLGRLFDTDANVLSVHALLRSCIQHIDQFSKEALRQRKRNATLGSEPMWLDEYISEAYVPVEKDIQVIRGALSKLQKRYEEVYRPLRNKLVAHKEIEAIHNVDGLLQKTNIAEIEQLLGFLHQVQNTVFQLLHNGRLTQIGEHSFDEELYVARDVQCLLERLKP